MLGVALCLLGLVFTAVGVWDYWKYAGSNNTTTAEVVAQSMPGPGPHKLGYTVRFTTATGQTCESGLVSSSDSLPAIGEHVPVRYAPDSPCEDVIDAREKIFWLPLAAGPLMLAAGLTGVATLVMSGRVRTGWPSRARRS
jgi:uncharacterized protein DUF3592